jgi:hypothetical protein
MVGFGNAERDLTTQTCMFFDQGRVAMGALDALTDSVFFADIWVQFHTAVWELIPGTAQHWELCDDLRTLRWLYFKGEFKWDVLCQIPWHYADCYLPSSASGRQELKALRLLRLIKLSRMHSLKRRIANKMRNASQRVKVMITLAKLLLVLFLGAHWMSCLWFWVGFPNGRNSEKSVP